MKIKKLGKLAVATAAGIALITTLINDKKEKEKREKVYEK